MDADRRGLACVADDYDAALAPLERSLAGVGADEQACRLMRFGRWLRELSLSASAIAYRAEKASIAHSVAVFSMPAGSGEGRQAGDLAAARVMRDYEQACRATTRPWRTPQPPGDAGRK